MTTLSPVARLAGICLALALASPAQSAGKYEGWTGDDCVSMGKRCMGNCDQYGVPETKAGCNFNCTQAAMQCIDIVKGEASTTQPGGTGPRGPRAPVRAPLSSPQIAPTR